MKEAKDIQHHGLPNQKGESPFFKPFPPCGYFVEFDNYEEFFVEARKLDRQQLGEMLSTCCAHTLCDYGHNIILDNWAVVEAERILAKIEPQAISVLFAIPFYTVLYDGTAYATGFAINLFMAETTRAQTDILIQAALKTYYSEKISNLFWYGE